MSGLYDVEAVEIATRYVREQSVECLIFHKVDGTAVLVRQSAEQLGRLRDLLTAVLARREHDARAAR